MLTCKQCGKKFKNMQALGGHVSAAHSATQEAPPVEAEPVAQAVAEEETPAAQEDTGAQAESPTEEEDEGILANIRYLRSQRYSAKQIKEQFGYARSTVDQVFAEDIEPEGKGADDGSRLPVTVKGTEIITPEAIMQRLADGSRDWHLRLEGMMLLRAAQKMVRDDVEIMRAQVEAETKMVEPVLKLMKEAREEQDAAAQRARESTMEAASAAAGEAAARATVHIDQRFDQLLQQKPDIAQAPDPMKGLMARTMESIMNRLTGMLFGGEAGPTPGLVDRRK